MSTDEADARKEAEALNATIQVDPEGRIRVIIPPNQDTKYPCKLNTVLDDTDWTEVLRRIRLFARCRF